MGFHGQRYWSGLPVPSPGDLPTQGSNLDLLHCRQILYHLSHQGSPHLFYISSVQFSHSVVSESFQPHGLYPTRLLHPWNFPGKSTGVGCHFLLQELLQAVDKYCCLLNIVCLTHIAIQTMRLMLIVPKKYFFALQKQFDFVCVCVC